MLRYGYGLQGSENFRSISCGYKTKSPFIHDEEASYLSEYQIL